jgi:hypothetical protein
LRTGYAGREVAVVYDRVSETEWRARVPTGGRTVNGAVYFGSEDGGRVVPSLNIVLNGSDADVECALSSGCI